MSEILLVRDRVSASVLGVVLRHWLNSQWNSCAEGHRCFRGGGEEVHADSRTVAWLPTQSKQMLSQGQKHFMFKNWLQIPPMNGNYGVELRLAEF
jgi:hypothetical protein